MPFVGNKAVNMTGKWECFMFILEDKHKTGEPAEPDGFISCAHLGEKPSTASKQADCFGF